MLRPPPSMNNEPLTLDPSCASCANPNPGVKYGTNCIPSPRPTSATGAPTYPLKRLPGSRWVKPSWPSSEIVISGDVDDIPKGIEYTRMSPSPPSISFVLQPLQSGIRAPAVSDAVTPRLSGSVAENPKLLRF